MGRHKFLALELSLDVVRDLRGRVGRLRSRDPKLYDQIRRALTAVPLNLSEGNRRTGKDRLYHFRVALGSASEVHTALRVAVAWGELDEGSIEDCLAKLDRLQRMIRGLTN